MTDRQNSARYAMRRLMSKGWAPHQAAGIVGNLIEESGLRASGAVGDNGTAFGIAQWRGDRLSNLKNYAASKGKPWTDFDAQLDFVDHELNGAERSAGARIRAATTVTGAAEGMIMFERPLGSNNGARNAHNYAGRVKSSQAAMEWMGLTSPIETPTSQQPYAAPEGAPINYDINQNTSAPTPLTVSQQAALPPVSNPYDTFGEELKAGAQSDWYTSWAMRRMSEGTMDLNYMGPSADEWKSTATTVPENYHDYLLGAGSESVYQQRLKFTQEDMVRQQRLSDGGGSAFGARLLAGIADPIAIPANILSGGIGASVVRTAGLGVKIAAGAALGGVTNAAMEIGAKAAFDDPNTDPLMALGVGALLGGIGGSFARNASTQVEAQMAARLGSDAINEAKGFVTGRSGAGAAVNNAERDSLIASDFKLDQEDVATAIGGRLRVDAAGQMTTSSQPLTRLVGQTFFEETAGFKDHSVIPDPVSVKATSMNKKLFGNFNAVFAPAMKEFSQDIGRLNLVGKSRKADEFRALVSDAAEDEHLDPNTHPAVARAAGALRTYYDGYRKEISSSGLMDLDPDTHYVPKMSDHAKIAELDNNINTADMEAFIKQAILKHTATLEDGLASRMAKGYWRTIRRAGYGIEDGMNHSLGMGDKEAFKKQFAEALDGADVIDVADLDKVYDILAGVVDQTKTTGDGSKGVSRLKRRSLLDYTHNASLPLREGGRVTVSMRDLFVRDAEHTARRYGRQMSGRIAFANTPIRNPKTGELLMNGIKSDADLERLKDMVKEEWRLAPGTLGAKKTQLNRALENIDFGWKRINGIPIYGQEKSYNEWVRRIKSLQFIRLMANMGLNQVQESWKLASLTGFRAAMTQLPAIRRMVDDVGADVPKQDKLLGELEHMTGMGLDGLWGRYDHRFDEDRLGAMSSSTAGRLADTAIDFGQAMTSQVSMMKAIHGYQQKWAVKAIAQQLYGIAKKTKQADGSFNLDTLKGKNKERLAAIGLGPKEVQSLFRNMLAHSEADGNKLVSLGSNKWDADVVTKFTHTLNRYTNRLVQENDVGGLNRWMSVPVVGLFTQFRSFVFGAFAKSTLYSLHHMDPRMMVLLLGELAFGVATFVVRQGSVAAATEEGREKFWDETMDPVNLLKNGWARTATSSIIPMIMDTALLATPIGPQFGSARASGSPTDAIFGSPAVGHAQSMMRFTKGAIDSTLEGRDMAQSELKEGMRSISNFIPISMWFANMIEDRPKTPPRN